jgi:hypothetical protein
MKLLFIGMPVDKFVRTDVKLLYVYFFFMNSSKLYFYSSGNNNGHSSNLIQWFSHSAF